MSTTSRNNIVRSVAPKSLFESALPVLTTAVTYNQGDLIAFDSSNHRLKAFASTADAANLIGVARQKIVAGVVPSPVQGTLVDASVAIEDQAGPVYGVVVSLILKTGDAFNPGDKVYATNTDAQTVTSTDPGDAKYIGIFQGVAVASAVAGQFGDILVGCRYGLGATAQINF